MNLIELNPEKKFGKPIIAGTRITVQNVLQWLASGMSKDDILNEYPELDEDKIHACLTFAANREAQMAFVS
jgi:uncharacterized protein (DUF433 family)